MKLSTLAAAIGGEVVGAGEVEVTQVAEVGHAGPGTIVMVRDAPHLHQAESSDASALLLPATLVSSRKPAIRTPNVQLAFARALAALHPVPPAVQGVHPTAVVGPGTRLGVGVALGPYVVVGEECSIGDGVVIHANSSIGREVTIGDHTIIYPQVTVYDRSAIGRRVRLHSGVVIGSDGFGYVSEDSRRVKIPHIGRVVIEDDVEIGANTTVDRATLGETRIGAGTKIDNLVQIGHNVTIGTNSVIVAQVGISGSVTIGSGVTIAGQVGVVDHVSIGDGSMVLGRSVVTKNVPPGAVVSGDPARPHREALRTQAALHRLTDVLGRLDRVSRSPQRGKSAQGMRSHPRSSRTRARTSVRRGRKRP